MKLKTITKYENVFHWLRPQPSWCTLSVDASISGETGKIAGGWVTRDSNGEPLLLSSIVLDGHPDINAAGLISLEKGLGDCLSVGMRKLLIETENTTFHNVRNDIVRDMRSPEISMDFPHYLSRRAGCMMYHQSTYNIRAMLMELDDWCIRKIDQNANKVADHLAMVGTEATGRTRIIMPNEMWSDLRDLAKNDIENSEGHAPVDCEEEGDELW